MPWFILGFMSMYGLLSCIFAFVEPPRFIASIFKIPAIFIFLPDRLVVPAGRLAVGIASLAVAGTLYYKLSAVL